MDKRLGDLQVSYIAELRSIAPGVEKWWQAGNARNAIMGHPQGLQIDFDTRWPAGKSSHPRVLAVFRKYFLQVETINALIDDESRDTDDLDWEASWGKDTPPPERGRVLPIELLVEDIEDEAPDVFEFVEGLVFVPIGEDDENLAG